MNADRFISSRLRFEGKLAVWSVAVSFLIMIVSVSISSGFRKEIRNGVSAISGDIQLTPSTMDYVDESDPVNAHPSYYDELTAMPQVKSVDPVVYRAGIVKNGDEIQGVLFKGVQAFPDSVSLGASIPSRLADMLALGVGDKMTVYFVGEKIKFRRFTVTEIYPALVDTDESMLVRTSLKDMQRLNDWDDSQASALEVTLRDAYKSPKLIELTGEEVGATVLSASDSRDDATVSTTVVRKYPKLFDWLNLIDFNVFVILGLMTVVAGFNMISGLLILLFRNISTIGTLKSMGMTDRGIAKVFLRLSSRVVLKGLLIGNAAALLFCIIQDKTHLIRLNPANYFVSFVPVSLNLPMIVLADVAAYGIIMLLLLIPGLFISKVDPAVTVGTR